MELSEYLDYLKHQRIIQNEGTTQSRREEGQGHETKVEWPKGRFWEKGFEILQNIQEKTNLEGQLKRARDQVTQPTQCLQPNEGGGKCQRFDDKDRLFRYYRILYL